MKIKLTKLQIKNLEYWDIYLPNKKIKSKKIIINDKSNTNKINTQQTKVK
jgi:hypothetical protein